MARHFTLVVLLATHAHRDPFAGTVSLAWHSAHVEFHLTSSSPDQSGPAYINAVLIRVRDTHTTLERSLSDLGGLLALSPPHTSLVLETGKHVDSADVQSLLDILSGAGGVAVQHRTCDDAHRLAHRAEPTGERAAAVEVLSPFWCSREHASSWES